MGWLQEWSGLVSVLMLGIVLPTVAWTRAVAQRVLVLEQQMAARPTGLEIHREHEDDVHRIDVAATKLRGDVEGLQREVNASLNGVGKEITRLANAVENQTAILTEVARRDG